MSKFNTKNKESGSDNDWLMTYSDMVTLLMAFFVLLLTISSIDQSKVERMQEGLNEQLYKKEVELPFTSLEEKIMEIIKEKKLEQDIVVKKDSMGVTVKFKSSVMYTSGSAEIKLRMMPILKDFATTIKQSNYQRYVIEVEGHTDDVPIRTIRYPTNWELSASRATNVVRFMIGQGIPKEKIRAIGYGDSRPEVPNRDLNGKPIRENRAKNRRVLLHIQRAS